MSLQSAMVTYLTAQSGITNLISTRLYPHGSVPERTANKAGQRVRVWVAQLPLITYEVRERSLHITSGHSGLSEGEITLHCYDQGPLKTIALAEALRQEMDGFQNSTWGATTIDSCTRRDSVTAYDPPTSGHDGRDRISVDYEVYYLESVPTF